MNSREQQSPQNGDSVVVGNHLFASGRKPVVIVVQETKIKVPLVEKEKSGNGPQRNPRMGDASLVSSLMNY